MITVSINVTTLKKRCSRKAECDETLDALAEALISSIRQAVKNGELGSGCPTWLSASLIFEKPKSEEEVK